MRGALVPALFAFAPAAVGAQEALDVIFVIDTSESTGAASGADLDGDGEVGRPKGQRWMFRNVGRVQPSTDRGDDLLAAEIKLVHALLAKLDPATTRAGLVWFAGDGEALTADAQTEVPLTFDYQEIERGLEQLRERGSQGRTNMVSGVQIATLELLGSQSASSEKRESAGRRMVFLSDGPPTLPVDDNQTLNMRMVIQQAARAAKASVRIDTFAFGEAASVDPITLQEMARVTGGTFTAISDASQLARIAGEVPL